MVVQASASEALEVFQVFLGITGNQPNGSPGIHWRIILYPICPGVINGCHLCGILSQIVA